MKKLIFLFALIFALSFSISSVVPVRGGADQVDFPDIYIDGATGGVGSEADPYTNLSDINWTTGGDNSIFDYLAGSPSQSPTIHLAKDVTWRAQMTVGCSGIAAYPIIITSYGSGADPKIYGSDQLTGWETHEGDIWICSHTGAVTGVFFDESGTITWGNKVADHDSCVAEYDWYSDATNTYCYAATDPDDRYTAVEGTYRTSCITADGTGTQKNYVTIDGIDCEYSAGTTIYFVACDNWIIQNCTVAYNGGVKNSTAARGIHVASSGNALIQNNIVHDISLAGIWLHSSNSYGASSGFIVQYNELYDVYHSPIDVICGNNGVINGGVIRYNLVYCSANFDTSVLDGALIYAGEGQDADDVLQNIDIYYNVLFNVHTKGIQCNAWVDGINIYNNTIYGTLPGCTPLGGIRVDGANNTNIVIKNNICMDVTGGQLWVQAAGKVSVCENNCWYHSGGGANVYAYYNGTSYHFDDQAAYKAATTWDDVGLWEDPKMRDVANDNFRLFAHSPGVDAGVDVGLTVDYDGVRIHGKAPDMGAFETIPVIIARWRELMKDIPAEAVFNDQLQAFAIPKSKEEK